MRLRTYYRAELLKNLNISTNSGEKVLDVGCFDGYWLSTQKAKEKHALDIDVVPAYKGIKYKKGDATKSPYKSEYFDKVFAFDVIEHIEKGKEKEFLEELLRVTKINGQVMLTTPSKGIKIFPRFLTNWVSKKWGHYKCNGYSPEEIKIFLPKNIKFVKIKYLPAKLYLRFYFLLRFIWKINPSLAKKFIKEIAKKDAKLNDFDNTGYLFIRIIK